MKGHCSVVSDTPTVDHTNSFNRHHLFRCQHLNFIPATHKPSKTQASTYISKCM